MDLSNGVQIPEGLLPGVSVLKPGLALCLKHSQVDKRYVDDHIELLNQFLPRELYPAFMMRDTTGGNIADTLAALARIANEAHREKRLYFVYSPFFAARLPALEAEVDHVFFYSPGLRRPLILADKINGESVSNEGFQALQLAHLGRRPLERKGLKITLPEGVNQSEASRIISDALAAKYSGAITIHEVNGNEH